MCVFHKKINFDNSTLFFKQLLHKSYVDQLITYLIEIL